MPPKPRKRTAPWWPGTVLISWPLATSTSAILPSDPPNAAMPEALTAMTDVLSGASTLAVTFPVAGSMATSVPTVVPANRRVPSGANCR